MASVSIGEKAEIDYSLVDGHIRLFVLDGVVLFKDGNFKYWEKPEHIEIEGWKQKLINLINDRGLNDQEEMSGFDGEFHGFHAFVYKLFNDGEIYFVDTRGKKRKKINGKIKNVDA